MQEKTEQPKPEDELTLLRANENNYPSSPSNARLEAFTNSHPERDYWIEFDCPEFTSLCPITGQPDSGHITIRYIADQACLESKALKLYLFSFRNEGAFHEQVVNQILDNVVAAIFPRKAIVRGEFRPRGGIAITVEASHPNETP